MTTIAIFPNLLKKNAMSVAKDITKYLKQKAVRVVAPQDVAASVDADSLEDIDGNSVNYLISIGGDGTILRLVHSYPHLKAPILGINMGSLGFLADVPNTDVNQSLDDLLSKKYKVLKRMIIEGQTQSGQTFFAVNDIVLHRAKNPSLIDLRIEVDGRYLNTFSADGLIISTPSGSTAYSLSAGGPIVTPDLKAVVITPICPHAISNRPIVLMPSTNIVIKLISDHEPIEISYDGISGVSLAMNEELVLKASSNTFCLLTLDRNEYYSTLRSKLGWTGKLKHN
ncbi:MAG: NAD(+)/NADH kinase [Parachlamydiales bacterium]|nr:NAD(+)/NADH kinase [Parachlamydiales bacterium]